MDKETDRILNSAKSIAYTAFGLGAERFEFAERIIRLEKESLVDFKMIFDIAGRLLFVDRLRFSMKENIQHPSLIMHNLDGIETYLLCTCIDTLAGGRSYIFFPKWVEGHPEQIQTAFSGRTAIGIDEYSDVTESLFSIYDNEGIGLTRQFVDFFFSLPVKVRSALTGAFVVMQGDLWSEEGLKRLEDWNDLSDEDKIKKIVRKYLYGVRRNEYTHSSHVASSAPRYNVTSESMDEHLWSHVPIYDLKKADRVAYSVSIREGTDEGFLLRAVVVIDVLEKIFRYAIPEEYFQTYLEYYAAKAAIYAFLHEMDHNRDYLDLLTSLQALIGHDRFQHNPLSVFSLDAGERLLEKLSRSQIIHVRDIVSYLYWLRKLNSQINEINSNLPSDSSDWLRRRNSLAEFSQQLTSSNEVGQLYEAHKWLYSNLTRNIENGDTNYLFRGFILK